MKYLSIMRSWQFKIVQNYQCDKESFSQHFSGCCHFNCSVTKRDRGGLKEVETKMVVYKDTLKSRCITSKNFWKWKCIRGEKHYNLHIYMTMTWFWARDFRWYIEWLNHTSLGYVSTRPFLDAEKPISYFKTHSQEQSNTEFFNQFFHVQAVSLQR